MFKVTQGEINVTGLTHFIGIEEAPAGKRIQVFVYSKRSKKWYAQPNPIVNMTDPTRLICEVTLGNAEFTTGHYKVVAVVLDGEPVWGEQTYLPHGVYSEQVRFHRIGL